MFSGIIQQLATVETITPTSGGIRISLALTDQASTKGKQPVIGSSHAVQGVCLTLTKLEKERYWFDISNASLEVTNLAELKAGSLVNIEPAMRIGDSIDGHLISGHIDAVATIDSITQLGDNHEIQLCFPIELAPYIATKGSICIDGVSLTINQVTQHNFTVNIIPYTWSHTCFSRYQKHQQVNLEIDLLARYAVNALKHIQGTILT